MTGSGMLKVPIMLHPHGPHEDSHREDVPHPGVHCVKCPVSIVTGQSQHGILQRPLDTRVVLRCGRWGPKLSPNGIEMLKKKAL